jgi:uncharacterized repeat protein (TIGR03803 family)
VNLKSPFTFLRKLPCATLLLYTLTVLPGGTLHAQTFTVLHSFTGGADGSQPQAGVIQDARGAVYGTTSRGGSGNRLGVAYRLTYSQSGWVVSTLAEFGPDGNGYEPFGRLTLGPDGAYYGTTAYGGPQDGCGGGGCGTVFRLNPTASFSRTVIYRFSGLDGARPFSEVTFDSEGNIFGTTVQGGATDGGTVFELVRNGHGWAESVIYSFDNYLAGVGPQRGLILDSAGNLYGTTLTGGDILCQCGVVFELSPSTGGWTYRLLHTFDRDTDGGYPICSLTMDTAGNLYGTTSAGGQDEGGTVFELSPSGNNWNFSTIYSFANPGGGGNPGPAGGVIMDAAGSLYGTTFADGAYAQGSVFKLASTNGGWEFTSLHDFLSQSDGEFPAGNVLMDASGNLFGTTTQGGANGDGTVWEITP